MIHVGMDVHIRNSVLNAKDADGQALVLCHTQIFGFSPRRFGSLHHSRAMAHPHS